MGPDVEPDVECFVLGVDLPGTSAGLVAAFSPPWQKYSPQQAGQVWESSITADCSAPNSCWFSGLRASPFHPWRSRFWVSFWNHVAGNLLGALKKQGQKQQAHGSSAT